LANLYPASTVSAEQLPVLATEARPIDRHEDPSTELAQPIVITPAMQVAAATAASVVAGAAVVLGVKHRRALRPSRRRRKNGNEVVKVLTTRSFLVDVHLVDKR
jgi:hypothetical protein